VWYNKNVAKRESKVPLTHLFTDIKNFLVKELISMSKKMTIVEQYENLIEKYADFLTEEEIAFIRERAELHAKKNGNRKPTVQQLKNKEVADSVLAYLRETGKKMQIKQMIKEIPCLASIPDCTPQYAMAIVRPMKDNGIIARIEEKGVAYFYATNTDED
jgi:hypothetical protein